MKIFGREPVMWLSGVIPAVLTLLVAFNVNLTEQQMLAMLGLVAAILGTAVVSRNAVFAKPETVGQVKAYIEAAPPAVADKAVAQVSVTNSTTSSLLGTGGPIALLLGLMLVMIAGSAFAASKPATERFSAGVEFGAQWLSSDVHPSAMDLSPLGYVTFNTSELTTLAMSYQRGLTHNWGAFRAGGRLRVAELQRARLYAGVDYLHWDGAGASWIEHKNTVEFSMNGSVPVLSDSYTDPVTLAPHKRTLIWLVGKAALDPQNDEHPIKGWRLALRYQGLGGKE